MASNIVKKVLVDKITTRKHWEPGGGDSMLIEIYGTAEGELMERETVRLRVPLTHPGFRVGEKVIITIVTEI